MEHLEGTIKKLYDKYFPILKNLGVTLDLDFPDTTLRISNRARVEDDLDRTLRNAAKRSRGGRILISIRPDSITVIDDGTTLSPSARRLLESDHVKVKSKLGFGTEVKIS